MGFSSDDWHGGTQNLYCCVSALAGKMATPSSTLRDQQKDGLGYSTAATQ